MLPQHKLDALLDRYRMIEHELASQVAPDTYVKLSREFSELGPVIETVRNYRHVTDEIAGLEATDRRSRDRLRNARHGG